MSGFEKSGFIVLHRKLMEKSFYKKDSEKLHLWIHLLLKANHSGREEYFNGLPIRLNAGQFTTGRKQLSQETGISESKIQRILTYFEEIEHQIEQQTSSTNRIITIVNWKLYQFGEQQTEQLVNSERTTSEQRVNSERTHYNNETIKQLNNVNNERVNANSHDSFFIFTDTSKKQLYDKANMAMIKSNLVDVFVEKMEAKNWMYAQGQHLLPYKDLNHVVKELVRYNNSGWLKVETKQESALTPEDSELYELEDKEFLI